MKDPLTASTALRAGEIDFITRVPMQQVPLLEKSPGVKVVTGPDNGPHHRLTEHARQTL